MRHNKNYQIVIALCVALLLSALAVFDTADGPSEKYLEDSLQRALIAFGTARALNGVISVAQGTEIALEPAGVGVNFSPGEILDPINDLIERFSWVMLAASSSLGVQKLMLSIGSWWPVTALLVGCLFAAVWGLWRGVWQQPWYKRTVGRLLILSLVLRFAVPLMSVGGEVIYQNFLANKYTEASAQLEATREEVDLLNQKIKPDSQQDRGIFSRLGQLASEVSDWRSHLDQYQAAAEKATRSALDLIVIFVFQTAVMPMLFAWWMLAWVRSWFTRVGREPFP